MIGIRLFGPALYFAEIHLITSFTHLDFFSESHPAPRLRVKLMGRLLKQLYDVQKWHPTLQQFVAAWDEAGAVPLSVRDRVSQIALECINTDRVLQAIIDLSEVAVAVSERYTPERFLSDVEKLVPLFIHLIPPGELHKRGNLSSFLQSSMRAGLCTCANSTISNATYTPVIVKRG